MVSQNNNHKNPAQNSKAACLAERIRQIRENIAVLRELWIVLFGESSPNDYQFTVWLNRYPFEIIEEAFAVTAEWVNRHRQALELILTEEHRELSDEEIRQHTKTLLDLIRYASGVMSKKVKGESGHEVKTGRPYDQL